MKAFFIWQRNQSSLTRFGAFTAGACLKLLVCSFTVFSTIWRRGAGACTHSFLYSIAAFCRASAPLTPLSKTTINYCGYNSIINKRTWGLGFESNPLVRFSLVHLAPLNSKWVVSFFFEFFSRYPLFFALVLDTLCASIWLTAFTKLSLSEKNSKQE